MFKQPFHTQIPLTQAHNPLLLLGVVIFNLLFNIVSNVCFKVSANSASVVQFIVWQVFGNLAGFLTVITLTWLLKYVPLQVAFPLTTGLAIIGVNVIASLIFFKEPVSATQWLGAIVIIAGIVLVTK